MIINVLKLYNQFKKEQIFITKVLTLKLYVKLRKSFKLESSKYLTP